MPNAVYRQALDAVVTTIQALSLTDIPSDEIVVRKRPWDDRDTHVGITVWPNTERIDDWTPAEGTNNRDMVGYPCVVTMITGTSRGWDENLTKITTWRQTIRRAFHNQRLDGVSETGTNRVICKVEHEAPTIPKEYVKNRDASQLVVWCWFLEKRTQ